MADDGYDEAAEEAFGNFRELVKNRNVGGFVIIGVSENGEDAYCMAVIKDDEFEEQYLIDAVAQHLHDITGEDDSLNVESRSVH